MIPNDPSLRVYQDAAKYAAVNAQILINAQIDFMIACKGIHDENSLKNMAIKIFNFYGLPYDLIENRKKYDANNISDTDSNNVDHSPTD